MQYDTHDTLMLPPFVFVPGQVGNEGVGHFLQFLFFQPPTLHSGSQSYSPVAFRLSRALAASPVAFRLLDVEQI